MTTEEMDEKARKAYKEYRIAAERKNKQDALYLLIDALKLQEMYLSMRLDEKGETVTVTDLTSQSQKQVCVWGDNIRAMLSDVLKAISDWS